MSEVCGRSVLLKVLQQRVFPDLAKMETEQQQSNRNDAPMVVIWQPDGSLAIGADPARVSHKERAAADSSSPELEPTAEETAAAHAAVEERRAAALQYRQTTLRRRQIMFLALIACDLLFFLGSLIYQGLKRQQLQQDPWSDPTDDSALTVQLVDSGLYGRRLTWDIRIDDDDSSSSGKHRNLPVSWWLDPYTLRIEDTVFSFAMDLLGITGAIQLRTTVLTLYCIIQVLSTAALSTVAGLSLSLFTMFRMGLLLLAFYLRSAVLVYGALLEAADLPLAPSAASRLLRSMPHPVIGGVMRMVFRRGRHQERSEGSSGSSPSEQVQEMSAIPVSSRNSRAVLLHGLLEREAPANAAAGPVSAAAALRRSSSSSGHL